MGAAAGALGIILAACGPTAPEDFTDSFPTSGGWSGNGAVAGHPGNGGTTSSGGSGGTTSTGGSVGTGGGVGTGGSVGTGGTVSTGGSAGTGGAGGASGMGTMFAGAGRGGSVGTGGSAGTGLGTGGTSAGAGGKTSFGGNAGTGTFGGAGRGGSGGAGAGGKGAGGMTGSAGASAFSAVATIIGSQCGSSSCHGGRQRPTLSSSNLSTLYSTLTSTTVSQCGGDHLVTKSDTANTALLELVQHQCGGFVMPQGCTQNPCFSSADMTTITNWVTAGAPGP